MVLREDDTAGEGHSTPADTAPETQAVRAALRSAIQAGQLVTFAYGRGSTPGSTRTVRPLAFLDDDLFEGVQVAPEERQDAQSYRASCVLFLSADGVVYENPHALDKCRYGIEQYKRGRRLDEQIAAANGATALALPAQVEMVQPGLYAWSYAPGVRPMRLRAPSDHAMAAFAMIVGAAAVESRTGHTQAIMDAMVRSCIDWPGWYSYSLHLERRMRQYERRHAPDAFDSTEDIPELDWPGLYALSPHDVIRGRRAITRLYDALVNVPPNIRVGYLQDIREDVTLYYPSQLSHLTAEEIAALADYGLAELLPLSELLPRLSIAQMKSALCLCGLPLPEKKNRRAPFEAIVLEHAPSRPDLLLCLQKSPQSPTLKAPTGLTWTELHQLRSQLVCMSRLLYLHCASFTTSMPMAHILLSG